MNSTQNDIFSIVEVLVRAQVAEQESKNRSARAREAWRRRNAKAAGVNPMKKDPR